MCLIGDDVAYRRNRPVPAVMMATCLPADPDEEIVGENCFLFLPDC
jgi:hypothetical protein